MRAREGDEQPPDDDGEDDGEDRHDRRAALEHGVQEGDRRRPGPWRKGRLLAERRRLGSLLACPRSDATLGWRRRRAGVVSRSYRLLLPTTGFGRAGAGHQQAELLDRDGGRPLTGDPAPRT